MASFVSQFIQQTYRQPYGSTVARHKANVLKRDHAESYDDFIWALARKFTNSRAEAQVAANEMFSDIRKFAERGVHVQAIEDRLIARIALRRLLKFLE